MAIDKRGGSKLPKDATRENTPGLRIDPGPFIGIVKNNVDSARTGKLEVFIPELAGDEQEEGGRYTVRYASPFFGSTRGLPGSPDENSFGIEQQTYGFWAIPPDINNLVLCIFVAGDPNRGYYFACIPNTPQHHMVPAISRMQGNSRPIVNKEFTNRVEASGKVGLPVTEKNTNIVANDTDPNFINSPKLVHSYQANIVLQQGLDRDLVRGTVTSSSQRDTPSQVFGISTPGRTLPDTAEFPNLNELLNSQSLSIETVQSFPARKGGHSFVLDDGDAFGDNNLVRLRTAAGHQILLHDTANVIYITNSLGTTWIELTPEGSINIFSGNSVNVRAATDLNFHADANVNIHAGDTIKMYAGSTIQSQTKIQLSTASDIYNLNCGVLGIRAGGNMDIRSISGSWNVSGLLNVAAGNVTINTKKEIILSSNTNASTGAVSGWRVTSGELWQKADKVYLNTAGKVPVYPTAPLEPDINPPFNLYNQPNARFDNNTKRWNIVDKDFESIAPFTPTHEPWQRQTGTLKYNNGFVEAPKPQTPGAYDAN